MRGNYKSLKLKELKGTDLTVVARIHPFISPAAVPGIGIVYYSSRFDVTYIHTYDRTYI